MRHPAATTARPLGRRRGVASAAVALLATVAYLASTATAQAAEPQVRAIQPLVVLVQDQIARARPSLQARRVATVAARRPLTRGRTVLPVLARRTDARGRRWLQVRLPGRPNGLKGWIRTVHTRLSQTEWHLVVRLATRRVTAYQDGRPVRRFSAVIGAASTPTPRGRFFVEEAVRLPAQEVGGPFALAISARSEVLQEFNGGPGQIALHGTNRLGDPLGSAASHGCVRLSPTAITWLVRRIGRGVPVTVVA